MISDSTRSFRAYVKYEANQADTLLVEAGYADTLGPAAELLEVSVEVGDPHPQKQQGNPQPKTASGLIPVAQAVKNPLAMQETRLRSLGQEDPLEKDIATHSSILSWRIPMDRGAWQATVHRIAKGWT